MSGLSPEDFAALRRWQRRMIVSLVSVMALLLGAVAFDLLVGLSERAALLLFLAMLAGVIIGGWVQFSQKCPACGYRIGFQSRLTVPETCRRCGVRLRDS